MINRDDLKPGTFWHYKDKTDNLSVLFLDVDWINQTSKFTSKVFFKNFNGNWEVSVWETDLKTLETFYEKIM